MIWAESVGGPLALIETSSAGEWTGYEGDYERACAVDFVDVIPFGRDAQAVIFGDEPAATAFLPEIDTFVQWMYADPGVDVIRSLETVTDARWETGPIFEISGPLVLLDAALPGADVTLDQPRQDGFGAEALSIDIVPGRYRVESADVQPDEHTCFRLHRFVNEGE